jgi:hypothetical protein
MLQYLEAFKTLNPPALVEGDSFLAPGGAKRNPGLKSTNKQKPAKRVTQNLLETSMPTLNNHIFPSVLRILFPKQHIPSHNTHSQSLLLYIPLAISVLLANGCRESDQPDNPTQPSSSPATQTTRTSHVTTSLPTSLPENGNINASHITKKQAKAIANAHFNRNPDSGCYMEKRGGYYFVSPPYYHIVESEEHGVYIHMKTAKLYTNFPPDLSEDVLPPEYRVYKRKKMK